MSERPSQAPPAQETSLARRITPRDLATFDQSKFVAFAKDNPEEAGRILFALAREKTAEVPGTIFVRRGENMMLQKVTAVVILSEARKELVSFKTNKREKKNGEWEDNWVTSTELTAVGYRALNQTVGLHVITPTVVVVNNQRQPNPFVECDEKSGRPKVVYCRKVVVGPARDTGSLVATDLMLRFDLGLYLLENLMAKLSSKYTQNKENFARWGDATEKPDEPGWKFYAIADDAGVWVNMRHEAFAKAMQDHVSRMKFAERIAQTVAERNALKAHPGMPPGSPDEVGGGLARMRVVGWTSRWTQADLDKLRTMVEDNRLEDAGVERVERVTVEEASETDVADAEDTLAHERAAEESIEPDKEQDEVAQQREEPREEREEKPRADRAALLKTAMANYEMIHETHGPKKAKELLAKLGIEGEIADATDDQIAALADEAPF